MPIKWLEPAIQHRSNELFDRIIEKYSDCSEARLAEKIKKIDMELLLDLENTINLRLRKAVDESYRAGLIDGISIHSVQSPE